MIEKTLLAFWGVWLLLILAAAFRVFGFSIARRRQDRRWGDGSGPQKPVALIIPVKGFDLQATPRFFDAIFAQTYQDYRVIVCFECWDDPVAAWLCEHLEVGPKHPVWTHPDPTNGLRSVTLVCGGLAEDEGQKVHNQRAAFRDLTVRDAIVAFADADILCGHDWLARLVAPINRGRYELSTTYRWLVPKRPTLPNQLASVINASITTQGGAEWSTVLWGGSMAMTRTVFDEIDAPNLLAGSLNDDLRLSKAARATGRRIAFVRSLILPTSVDFTWRGFFEFVKRQYTQLKFFSPILYTGVNFILGLYVLGALSIVAALVYGYFFAWIPVAAAYIVDQFRALVRQQIYLSLFKDNGIRQKLFAASWLEHMLTPLWLGLHWLLLASTWTQRRLIWAGVRYRILSKSKTRILGRDTAVSPLPAGAPGLAMIGELHDRRRPAVLQPVPSSLGAVAEMPAEPDAAEAPSPLAAELSVPEAYAEATAATATETAFKADDPDSKPPIPHPGAPSAILPLSFNFHVSRSKRHRELPARIVRPVRPRIESLLRKTRIHPASFPLPSTEPAPRSEPTPVLEAVGPAKETVVAPSRRLLSAAEIALRKTRLDGKADVSPGASPSPSLPASPEMRTAAVRLATKTRLLPSSSSRSLPVLSAAQTPAAPVPRPLPAPSASSHAAHRTGPGLVSRFGPPPKRHPPRSGRALPAARPVKPPEPCPVPRGPSARL